jgi:hypothetical protein
VRADTGAAGVDTAGRRPMLAVGRRPTDGRQPATPRGQTAPATYGGTRAFGGLVKNFQEPVVSALRSRAAQGFRPILTPCFGVGAGEFVRRFGGIPQTHGVGMGRRCGLLVGSGLTGFGAGVWCGTKSRPGVVVRAVRVGGGRVMFGRLRDRLWSDQVHIGLTSSLPGRSWPSRGYRFA